ncbi:MAG: nuclease [Acidobacteriota bacterium]
MWMRAATVRVGVGLALAGGAGAVQAQQAAQVQAMGSVSIESATVTGGLEVSGGRARLVSNASVTAKDMTAPVALQRGGEVLVCSTSQFHLLKSGTGKSLLFGLDRGAIEIHGTSDTQDLILTPDLRFTLESQGTFHLSLRVSQDGDTCVDNAGVNAPVLLLNDAFSSAVYRLIPGQHVLFEHGSLREVVDNEKSPCGCPVVVAPVEVAVAPGEKMTPEQAAAAHPFPAAVSQGLAAETKPVENSTPGEAHTQVATTLVYGKPPEVAPVAVAKPAEVAPEPPKPPTPHGIAHAIGRFFRKLFHPHSE